MWHAGAGWVAGDATTLGNCRGWISATDGALLLEGVAATWEVVHEDDDWQAAPALRCVTGAAGEAFVAARAAQAVAGADAMDACSWTLDQTR